MQEYYIVSQKNIFDFPPKKQPIYQLNHRVFFHLNHVIYTKLKMAVRPVLWWVNVMLSVCACASARARVLNMLDVSSNTLDEGSNTLDGNVITRVNRYNIALLIFYIKCYTTCCSGLLRPLPMVRPERISLRLSSQSPAPPFTHNVSHNILQKVP